VRRKSTAVIKILNPLRLGTARMAARLKLARYTIRASICLAMVGRRLYGL